MRVLLVNDYPVTGGYGAESYVRRLAAGLAAAGDQVDVWAGEISHTGPGRLLDLWDPLARRALARRVREFDPGVVHFHNVVRELSASVLTGSDLPAVMTVHDHRLLGVPDRQPVNGNRLRHAGAAGSARLVASVARRRLRATMAVSARLADRLRRAGFPAVSVVPVPVESPAVPPVPVEQCHDVAVVGRLSPDKGPHVALAAFERVATRHSGSRLVVAGDGPLYGELRRSAAPLGNRVLFTGHVDPIEVSRIVGRCRLVVVASLPGQRPEGAPTVVPEAAVHGRPVVVSDDPGLADVATRLGGALLAAAGDVPAFADAIDELLREPGRAAALGAAAAAAVDREHGLSTVTARVREVYTSAGAR